MIISKRLWKLDIKKVEEHAEERWSKEYETYWIKIRFFGRKFGAAWRRDNKESCVKKEGIAQESIKISGVFVSDKEESDNNDEKHNIVKRVKLTDAAKGKARKWSDFGEMY